MQAFFISLSTIYIVFDIALFVLKRDVKHQPTNQQTICNIQKFPSTSVAPFVQLMI